MKVKQVMIKKVITIPKEATVEEAAKILVKNNISGAPVVDKKGKMVGIISEKDLFEALYPGLRDILRDIKLLFSKEKIKNRIQKKRKLPIINFMKEKVITVDPETPVIKVGSIMLTEKIHRIPVVQHGKIVGIVSRRDIFRKILKNDLEI